MTPEDRKAFLEVVTGFAELKGKQLSAPALELYWRAMQDWSLEEFRAAATLLLRTAVFMPTPKEFEEIRNAGRMTAGEAWAWVLSHFGGREHSPDTPCPADRECIERAVRSLGGYEALGRNSVEHNDRLERRFAEHYEAIRAAENTREAVAALPGPFRPGGRLKGPRSATDLLARLETDRTVQ